VLMGPRTLRGARGSVLSPVCSPPLKTCVSPPDLGKAVTEISETPERQHRDPLLWIRISIVPRGDYVSAENAAIEGGWSSLATRRFQVKRLNGTK